LKSEGQARERCDRSFADPSLRQARSSRGLPSTQLLPVQRGGLWPGSERLLLAWFRIYALASTKAGSRTRDADAGSVRALVLHRVARAFANGLAFQLKEQRFRPGVREPSLREGPSEDSKAPILRGHQREGIALVTPELCCRQVTRAAQLCRINDLSQGAVNRLRHDDVLNLW